MTGFLQRLAAGAMRTRPRLHPLVGSIFGPAAPEAAALPEIDRLVEADPPMATPRAIFPETHIRAGTPVPADGSGEEASIARPFQAETPRPEVWPRCSESFQPLVPPAKADLSALSQIIECLSAHSDAAPNEDCADSAARIQAISTPRSPGNRRPESPLRSLPEWEAPVATPRQAGVPTRQKRASDDIQIHIGRIEVIAVPPPVAPPKAAPVPKAMSLDEYLSRRNRGVR